VIFISHVGLSRVKKKRYFTSLVSNFWPALYSVADPGLFVNRVRYFSGMGQTPSFNMFALVSNEGGLKKNWVSKI